MGAIVSKRLGENLARLVHLVGCRVAEADSIMTILVRIDGSMCLFPAE